MRHVTNPWIFFGVAGALVVYLLYMMIRKRKGERPGSRTKFARVVPPPIELVNWDEVEGKTPKAAKDGEL